MHIRRGARMRVFSIISVLISLCIMAFFAAKMMERSTAPLTAPAVISAQTETSSPGAPNIIDTTRALVSEDKKRQKAIEGLAGN